MQHCKVGQIVRISRKADVYYLVMGFDENANVYLYPLYRPVSLDVLDKSKSIFDFLKESVLKEVEKLLQGKMVYNLVPFSLVDSSFLIEDDSVFKDMSYYMSVNKEKIISFYLKNRMLYPNILPALETDIDAILRKIKSEFQSKPLENINGFVKYGIYANKRSTVMYLGYSTFSKQIYFYNLRSSYYECTKKIDANIAARRIKTVSLNAFFMKAEDFQYVYENPDKIRQLVLKKGLKID